MRFPSIFNTDVLTIRPKAALFQTCVFGVGVCALLAIAAALFNQKLVVMPVLLAFPLVPSAFLLGRPKFRIDRRGGWVTRYYLQPPTFSERRMIGDFNHLALFRKHTENAESRFGLALECDADSFELADQFDDYESARDAAERVAEFIGFDIRDFAAGNTTLRRRRRNDDVDNSGSPSAATQLRQTRDAKLISNTDTTLSIRQPVSLVRWIAGAIMLAPMATAFPVIGALPAQGAFAIWLFMLIYPALPLMLVLDSCKGVKIDRRIGNAYFWSFGGLRVRRHALDQFEEVVVMCDVVSSNVRKFYRYHARLAGAAGAHSAYETADKQQARRIAARLAAFLELPLRDHTKVAEDQPDLAAWVRQSCSRDCVSAQPVGSRVQISRQGEALIFTMLPSRAARIATWIASVVFAGAIALIGTFAAGIVGAQWQNLVLGLVAVAGCSVFLLLLAAHLTYAIMPWGRTEVVSVQPGEVRVERRWLVLREREHLSCEEMQSSVVAKAITPAYTYEFHELSPREVVRISSPSDAIEFGGWLTHAERLWLHDAVTRIACA